MGRALTPHEEIYCIYENRKSKPGLRTGAVENLTQRVGKLNYEAMRYAANGYHVLRMKPTVYT
jgi:hypothetical protein